MSKNENRSLWVTIGIAVLSILLSSYVAYTNGTDLDHQRISVIETQQENDVKRLDRIEDKLDRLLGFVTGTKH